MDFVRPMSLVMDDRGSQTYPRNAALRVSTKTKAPSPPGLKKVDCPGFSQWHAGSPHLTMDLKENLMDKELSLTVVLPGGMEKKTQVEGSKAVMDLLVTLCAEYRLNPSTHTLEEVTASRKNVKLKPNALIGTLKTDKIILKPKGEDQKKKTSPQMPEATVRMVINYKKTQKTVLRVNPQVPLHELLPAICEKCEFTKETTVLLRDVTSSAPLDLSKSLNDYTIREIYAKDMQGRVSSPVFLSSPLSAGAVSPGKDKNQKEKENKGLFSKFKKSQKKSEQPTTTSAPASPVLVSKPRPLSMALPCSNSSPIGSPNFSGVPKKRRAPQPPIIVSQSGHSDLTTRQRFNSEPSTQLDGIQRSPVSCGSSAESTLRRTKRKAPPPPTSPSPIVQKTVSEEEHLQVSTVLQEITEHEEAAGSVMSSVTTDTKGENGSLNVFPESSLHSPSPDAENRSTVEAGGEDQCLDLSSDGKRVDSSVNGSAAQGIEKRDDSNSSEPAVTNSVEVQVEDVHPEPISEGTKADSSGCSLLAPVKKDAEVQASCDAQTKPPRKPCDESASSVTVSAPCPAGADTPVQTDSKGLSVPPPQDVDKVALSDLVDSAPSGPAEKKDMSTSTEELEPPKPDCASLHATSTLPCQDSKPSVPALQKALSVHAVDPELKPKPSNELTRDYIPKVGMTTYKIVPQKSLEKLRYFEVALTLEVPPEASGGELGSGSPSLKEDQRQTEFLKEETEQNSNLTRDDSLSRTINTTTTLSTTTMQHTVNGSIPEPPPLSPLTSVLSTEKISPSANEASQAGSAAEVKEMKIPPATKPKPASFRLGQHKKTPGHYVTSAAEKNLVASPASGLKENQGSPDHVVLPSPPPLPPSSLPPAQCQEETAEVACVQFNTRQDNKNVPSMGVTRQSSLPPRQPGAGLSLVKLRSFAAPRPFSPPKPSRFAQAVSSAVKRTQSLSHGSKSPPSSVSPPISPITSPSSTTQSKGLSELKGEEVSQTAKESGL